MAPLRPLPAPTLNFLRHFSSTPSCGAKSSVKRLAHEHSAIPPYPYGPSTSYKQSNFGLYGQQKIRFGNQVSAKNEIKTRRHWRPNVHPKRLWSAALHAFVRVRVTTRVLRTLDKCGGLDEYLLGEKAGRIKELGMGGWKLRWRIMQTESVRERFRRQREELGLPPLSEVVAVGADGVPVSAEMVAEEIQKFDDGLAGDAEVGIGEDAEGLVDEGPFMEENPLKAEKIVL